MSNRSQFFLRRFWTDGGKDTTELSISIFQFPPNTVPRPHQIKMVNNEGEMLASFTMVEIRKLRDMLNEAFPERVKEAPFWHGAS